MKPVHFVVPGHLNQLTGGYLYDRHMVDGLRARGWQVHVHELEGWFPLPDDTTLNAAKRAWQTASEASIFIIDGLALLAFEALLRDEGHRRETAVIYHQPLSIENNNPTLHHHEETCLTLVDHCITTSHYTAQQFFSESDPSWLHVILPGTEKPQPMPQRSQPHIPFRWLCVGTITPRKGHHSLVQALAQLTDLTWELTCIGSLKRDSATALSLRELITKQNLTERIHLLGEQPTPSLREAYVQADGFVLASVYEGYGMVLAEAIAYGLPIISTTAGAIPYTVPPQAGKLVPPNDPNTLAQAMREMMENQHTWQQLTNQSQLAGQKLPTWEESVAQLETILNQ